MTFFRKTNNFINSRVFTNDIGSRAKGKGISNSIFSTLSNVFNCGKPTRFSIAISFSCEDGGVLTYNNSGVAFPASVDQDLINADTGEVLYNTENETIDFFPESISVSFNVFRQFTGMTVYVRSVVNGTTFKSNELFIPECYNINRGMLITNTCEGTIRTIYVLLNYSGLSVVDNRTLVLEYFDGVNWVELDRETVMQYSGQLTLSYAGFPLSNALFRVRILGQDDIELYVSQEETGDFSLCE